VLPCPDGAQPRRRVLEVLLDRRWTSAGGCVRHPVGLARPTGRASATRYEPAGAGWCQTFGGGLLSTCGLASTGAASTVDGVHHGLHGRVGHLPRERHLAARGGPRDLAVSVTATWWKPPWVRRRCGCSARSSPSCVRAHSARRGRRDNDSSTVAGHMFRHHLNLGLPVVGDGSLVHSTATLVGERTAPRRRTRPPMSLAVAPGPSPSACCTAARRRRAVRRRGGHGAGRLGHRQGHLRHRHVSPCWCLGETPRPGSTCWASNRPRRATAGRAQAERDGEVCWLRPGESRSYRTRCPCAEDRSKPTGSRRGRASGSAESLHATRQRLLGGCGQARVSAVPSPGPRRCWTCTHRSGRAAGQGVRGPPRRARCRRCPSPRHADLGPQGVRM
jgi:hypothetical protein